MTVQFLTPSTYLTAGSDLWIVPELQDSPYGIQVDWYLNFQASAAMKHKQMELNSKLKATVDHCKIVDPTRPPVMGAPLLIPTQQNLPNRWVLVLPGSSNASHWLKEAFRIWQSMQKPSLRIFLPKSADAELLKKTVQKMDFSDEITALTSEGP